MTTPYIDPKLIFASDAPVQDKPARFDNYAKGMDETRKNDGRPTIKQFNFLQQQNDQKFLYIHERGAALPYIEGFPYEENAPVVKDGILVQKKGDEWKPVGANKASDILDESGLTQQVINKGRLRDLYSFGAKGDGVTDDSDAIQKAVNYGVFCVTKGDFYFTKLISVKNDVSAYGFGGVLKPKVDGTVFHLNAEVKFLADNLIVDGEKYPFNWNAERGMYIFGSVSTGTLPASFTLQNSRLLNVYGSGVRCSADIALVKNNVLINVTGSNWTQDPSGAYDNYGDGIHIMRCKSAIIENNYVENQLASSSDNYIGRAGVVTEFGANNVTIANNYIAGYDRGIHSESIKDNVIKNNNVEKCGACLLLSDAKNSTIESNTFTANKAYSVGLFKGYAALYSYGGNSGCSYLNNKVTVTVGVGYTSNFVAIRFAGASSIKDILVQGNIVQGGFSSNGGENLVVENNTFNYDSEGRFIYCTGNASFINNTFKEGVQLKFSAIGGSAVIKDNVFLDVSTRNILDVTNPSSSGFIINSNRFYLKQGSTNNSVISAYMGGNFIGEMSNNLVVLPVGEQRSINLVEFPTSATLNKIYTIQPNLLLNSTGELVSLKTSSVFNMSRNSLDFYASGNSMTEPSDNVYYQVGSKVYLTDATNSKSPAFFVALNSGFAASTQWVTASSIKVNDIRYNGNNVYRSKTTATSGANAPIHTSGSASDGAVVWEFIGVRSIFKAVGAKGGTVQNATGSDNTASVLNSLISELKSIGLIS